LWAQDVGQEKKSYEKWEKRVDELETTEGGGLSRRQAIVHASKEFGCLGKLFERYDVSDFDPDPNLKPAGGPDCGSSTAQSMDLHGVVPIEGIDQSHRDNLVWAMDAAGAYLRTGRKPTTCPNNPSWWLFRQAIEEPKEFLSRFNQVEAKSTDDAEARQRAQRSGKWAIEELEEMLATLTEESEEQ